MKTVSDYSDELCDELTTARLDLSRRAKFHGVRSVRTSVHERADVPVLRVEMAPHFNGFSVSIHDLMDEEGLTLHTAFTTQEGALVGLFGPVVVSQDEFLRSGADQ